MGVGCSGFLEYLTGSFLVLGLWGVLASGLRGLGALRALPWLGFRASGPCRHRLAQASKKESPKNVPYCRSSGLCLRVFRAYAGGV